MEFDPVFNPYITVVKNYSDGETIIEEGSTGSLIYIILEGSVKVKKKTAKGMVTIDTLKEGEIFGEIPLLEESQKGRSAWAIATKGHVRIGLLNTEKLTEEYKAIPTELKAFIRSFTSKLRMTTSKVCSAVASRSETANSQ